CFDIPYFRTPEFYVGAGWYRKTFTLDSADQFKRLALEFDGIFQHAQVFVNGELAGTHDGGYTGFHVDITRCAKPSTNWLTVRADNHWDPRLAPRAGEHIFSGGIYRDVHLLITDPLHVTWNGTFVTTPDVSPERATVSIKTELHNNNPTIRICTLKTQIVESDDLVAQTE